MDLGISLEVISEIMGHTDTKTTRIYAKIREGLKNSEMEKWN
jgi:site-specific recombinase XerD